MTPANIPSSAKIITAMISLLVITLQYDNEIISQRVYKQVLTNWHYFDNVNTTSKVNCR